MAKVALVEAPIESELGCHVNCCLYCEGIGAVLVVATCDHPLRVRDYVVHILLEDKAVDHRTCHAAPTATLLTVESKSRRAYKACVAATKGATMILGLMNGGVKVGVQVVLALKVPLAWHAIVVV
jgi:hypothetical protein